MLDFFTAGGAFCVFKKLHHAAAGILTSDHQRASALFAAFLDKGRLAAGRAGNGEGPAAGGTDRVPFFNGTQTSGAKISKGTVALAEGAEAGIPLDVCTAMDAGLLIAGHFQSSCLAPHSPQKRVPGMRATPHFRQVSKPNFAPQS